MRDHVDGHGEIMTVDDLELIPGAQVTVDSFAKLNISGDLDADFADI